MIDLWTAFERLMREAAPLPAEQVALDVAVGRVAARQVLAPAPGPGFRRAMMDGYACQAADLANASDTRPVALRLTGAVRIGHPPSGAPARGEAWSITTGGMLPNGADTVVPLELTRRLADDALLVRARPRRAHVAEPDEDLRPGEVLLEAGRAVSPLAVAALAAAGVERVEVHRLPRVAVLATGDEIGPDGAALHPPRVRDVNGPAVLADLRSMGLDPRPLGAVGDEPRLLREAFAAAATEADLVLTSGGVSVGAHDYVAGCWRALGARPVLSGVNVKPGWPLFVGRLDARWVVGLSGSPAACLATYNVLVRPLVRRLAGHARVVRPLVPVQVEPGLPRAAEHTRLVWARVEGGEAPLRATLQVGAHLGKLTGIGGSNALVVVPPGAERASALLLDQPEDRASLDLPAWDGPPRVPAVRLVGPSNAGKTTAAGGLIRRLRASGLDVVAVKHAAHGFDLNGRADGHTRDSDHLAHAGASGVWVSAPGQVGVYQAVAGGRDASATELVGLAARLATAMCGRPPDLVLLEGFSASDLPRVEVGPPKPGCPPRGALLGSLAADFSEADLDALATAVADHVGRHAIP